ncbi:recombinase [Salmonella enterica]|nr:recombinase [Salmonella enterica]
MKIYIDDGSTNIKLQWKDDGVRQSISPNSFKREWAVAFGGQQVFNYMLNGEQYSFDPISPDAVVTTNVAWQYSDVNVVAVHHALLNCGIEPCEIDVVVSLPLSEYYDKNNQPNKANIERKKANLMRPVELNGGKTFTIKHVEVMPESIPAGFEVVKNLNELDSLLIVDLGGTTLDISQVMGKMRGISRIYGDSTLGVSLITGAVKEALSVARTKGSSYLADDIIIHRNDASYLSSRINDTSRIELVREAIESSHHRLVNRVIEAISYFEGYSHVMVIGGGAELIADHVKTHCGVREERFYKTHSSQFDLVNGMYLIG